MPVHESEMIVRTVDYFVTENILNPKASAAEVAAFVQKCKTTGQVNYTTNQGGTQGIAVIERTRLGDRDGNEVRRVLGMDHEIQE